MRWFQRLSNPTAFPLHFEDFWHALEELERTYPRVLPLTLWRAWELALYRRYHLPAPVLDVGCGDGRFFRQIWEPLPQADGVDLSPEAVSLARQSGVYRQVVQAPAHEIPLPSQAYAAVFSNCAFEHMDHIDQVLQEVYRLLHPGGRLLFSVVTDNLAAWAPLRLLAASVSTPEHAEALWQTYVAFHHLVNPLPQEVWLEKARQAGFNILEAWPIVPEPFARAFLFFDELWHVPTSPPHREIGTALRGYLMGLPRYHEGLRHIVQGLWALQPPGANIPGAGLIVWAERM